MNCIWKCFQERQDVWKALVWSTTDKTYIWWVKKKQKLEYTARHGICGEQKSKKFASLENCGGKCFFELQTPWCLVCLIFDLDTWHTVKMTHWGNLYALQKVLKEPLALPTYMSHQMLREKQIVDQFAWKNFQSCLDFVSVCEPVVNGDRSSEKLETMFLKALRWELR